jgi:HTH-type transcriptional regulator/antitoxin HigA
MSALAIKNACHNFAKAAAPYLYIKDEKHYDETLEVIEELLEKSEDNINDPLNAIIDILSRSIEVYENKDVELVKFDLDATVQPADLAMLRILMDQHKLGVADLPEIGSKSMVSRVLSGERSLNKNHIKALSDRYNISPNLFF